MAERLPNEYARIGDLFFEHGHPEYNVARLDTVAGDTVVRDPNDPLVRAALVRDAVAFREALYQAARWATGEEPDLPSVDALVDDFLHRLKPYEEDDGEEEQIAVAE